MPEGPGEAQPQSLRGAAAGRDVLAGGMFAVVGALGLLLGRDYAAGSLLRMGPGYLPRVLSLGLVLLGAAVALRGLLRPTERMERWQFRPILLVTAALLAFAWLIGSAGLVVASAVTVLVGALAGPEFRPVEAAALALALSVAAVLLFVRALGMPFTVWPA